MSKRQFKTQASSSRAVAGKTFGGFASTANRTTLSYVAELPDLSSITDPNIVVAFKSLSKSDATTKIKALDVLEEYISQHPNQDGGGVEDAVLETWVKFYPRLSINNHRRVREQAHNLQVKFLQSARKRMERHLPDTVGSWLSGCYDRDGFVARAAQNAIASFLDTSNKVTAFWTRCQERILDYTLEAIEETPETLSDERSTSPEDSQMVYLRVVCSSISLVTNLLLKLKREDVKKYQDKYEKFLRHKKLWAFASSDDAYIRKQLYQLLTVCLEKQPEAVENSLDMISRGFIAKGLSSSQSTSSVQLLDILAKLTAQFPQVWTSAYAGRGAPFLRIRDFVKKGSQGGAEDHWSSLEYLLSIVPPGVLPSDKETCVQFLTEYRNAIQHREQPRQHAGRAWLSYFSTVGIFVHQSSDSALQTAIIQESIFPSFDRYLQGEQERIPVTTSALAKAYRIWVSNKHIKSQDGPSFHIQKLASAFIARSLISAHVQPDDTEEYKISQKKIIAEGHRWFSLLAEIIQPDTLEQAKPMLSSSQSVFNSSIKTLIDADGKPYAAAAIVEIAMRLTPSVVKDSPEMLSAVKSLIENQIPQPTFMLSPSSRYLISVLYIFRSFSDQESVFEKSWRSAIHQLANSPATPEVWTVLGAILANDSISELAQNNPHLQNSLLIANLEAMDGIAEAKSLFETAITNDCYADSVYEILMQQILHHLSSGEQGSNPNSAKVERAFAALEFISKYRPAILSRGKESQMELTAMLLEITELTDKRLAARALVLKTAIENAGQHSEDTVKTSTLDLIRWNLELEPSSSRILLIETLVEQAEAFKNSHNNKFPAVALYPVPKIWASALAPTLAMNPNPALGVMRPFAGAVLLGTSQFSEPYFGISLDLKAFPVALRMALYTSEFMDDLEYLSRIPEEDLLSILHSLVLTAEVVSDQLDLLTAGEFPEWAIDVVDDELDDLRSFASNAYLSELIGAAKGWQNIKAQTTIAKPSQVINSLIDKLLEDTENGPGQYYATKAVGHLISSLVGVHRWDVVSGELWLSRLNIFSSATGNILGAIAILTGLEGNAASSKIISNSCNRLISDVAGASATSEKTFGILVRLNATLLVYQEDEIPVANNRLIFAVKQILSWAPDLEKTNPYLASEACRALQILLPAMKDVYGTYWESALAFCTVIWEANQNGELTDTNLPMTGMSLKLYATLRKLEDPNDDLEEALTVQSHSLSLALVDLLKLRRPKEHQLLEFVDTLLLRQLRDLPLENLTDSEEIYPLLASDNRNLQSAAYDLLSRRLPKAQQQISVDVLLEKTTARLPDELLSLLLDPPSIIDYADELLDEFPNTIRGYLLSWHLVYECYANASLRVRNDYSDLLKSENYISPLLGLLFDHLITTGNDLTNFESSMITSYSIWTAMDSESSSRDMAWLVVNLYYMCLKYTPGLTRAWWLDCKSKSTKIAASKWTEKFFSPILIDEVKEEVTKWSGEQEETEERKELIVKTSKSSPEIMAGYEIDDMMMQIVVTLPPDYPLQGVEVRGVNRVAVNEKTWRAWQVIAQGVMRLNTVVDGLILFRDNVVAAMSGKTECAICYSIIASDKRMPDKRCGTCKNLFHAGCLFKWFQSSNQSTCPLCRNPFTYSGETARRNREVE